MTTPLDPVALINQLTWQLAVTLAIALAVGALGGLTPGRAPLKADPPVDPEIPGAGTRELRPWQRAVVGAVAAAAVLFVADITTPLQLVCGSLVAGYAGNAVLSNLESRLIAMLARRDNAAMRRQIAELNADAKALAARFDTVTATITPPAAAAEIAAIRTRRNWT